MPSSVTYWADREAQKQKRVDEVMDPEIKKIEKAIQDTIDSLDEQIKNMYLKYAMDNKMTYADTLKYLTDDERAEFQRDLQYYIDKYHDLDYVAMNMKELQSLSVRARVKRFELFKGHLMMAASDLEHLLNTEARESIEGLYIEGYARQLYELEGRKAGEPSFVTRAFNPNLARTIMETPWSGKNYSDKVWDISEDFEKKLQEKLTQGLIQGKHPNVIAREFRTYGFGKTGAGGLKYRAETLMRTEAAYVIEQSQLNCYKDRDIDKYVFMTAKDRRVCDICEDIDGQTFEVDKAVVGDNYPPLHANCRCTTRAATRYDEDESQFDLPYDEWYAKYVEPRVQKTREEYEKTRKNS